MARTYDRRLANGQLPPMRFLALRCRRLWPTMAVGAVLSLPFLWRDYPVVPVFLAAAVPNLLLLPTLATPELFPLNTPAWSIFFELAANLVHAALLRRIPQVLLAVAVAVFAGALAAAAIHFGDLDLGARAANAVGGFSRVGFAYGLGVLLWRWHGDRPPVPVPPLLALVAMPLLFAFADRIGVDNWHFDLPFVVIACPLLLWGGLALVLPRRAERLCLFAGALSFPLYAVHYPLLLGAEAAGLPEWSGPVLALGAATVLTWRLGGLHHIPLHSRVQIATL
jgi:peptidoglycan/LPS O-acetylase OafA/YrhL